MTSSRMFTGIPNLLAQSAWLGMLCLLAQSSLAAEDPPLQLQAKVVAVEPGEPRIVELRLLDGSTLKIPMAAFSQASQAAILAAPPGARPERSGVAEGSSLAVIEQAVAQCRTAEEALRAVKLCLAGEIKADLDADAAAIVTRWEERAKRGEVRLGKEWVSADVATAKAEEAEKLLDKLSTMVGLGNASLVREYLEKASKIDPNAGRADFLLGLVVAFGIGQRADLEKAIRYFDEVVTREPGNGAAWNNLAVCEALARRFDNALAHFSIAAECLDQPQVVVANVGFMVGARGLSAKQSEAFMVVYEDLVPDRNGQRIAPPVQSCLHFLSPFLQPIPLTGQLGIAGLFVAPATGLVERVGHGIVVAPSVVLVPDQLLFRGGSVVVRASDAVAGDRPAQVIASSQALGLSLLRCEGLPAEPIPLAAQVAVVGSEALVVLPANKYRKSRKPGVVVALDVLPGRFVHTAGSSIDGVGAPLVDTSGRVIGLTDSTPWFKQPGTPRGFATPIERVWPFLKDHLPELVATEASNVARPWEKVAADAAQRLVTVVARPSP